MKLLNSLRYKLLSLAPALSLAFALPALGGGFHISVEKPSTPDPEVKGAAFVVRTFGCGNPTNAVLKVSAEGLVQGKRQTVTLPAKLTTRGVYAVARQWPSEGAWIVVVSGSYRDAVRSAIVSFDSGQSMPESKGFSVKFISGEPSQDQLDVALKNL